MPIPESMDLSSASSAKDFLPFAARRHLSQILYTQILEATLLVLRDAILGRDLDGSVELRRTM